MQDFVAIDFETANNTRSSVCSVGIVIVQGGVITDRQYRLIHPNPNYYNPWNTAVHGLTAADTDNAAYFPDVWADLSQYIPKGLPFVAHNSPFDESCLKAVFALYGMGYPEDYYFLCTCRASRRCFGRSLPNHQLHTVSAHCGYNLVNHHDALADAIACAHITLQIL